jgi:hypothetical protein
VRTTRPRLVPPRGLRLPCRTARLRLTVLYGAATFLACGAAVVFVTYVLYGLTGRTSAPVVIRRTPVTRERTLLQVTLADPEASTGTWQDVGQELLASNAEQEHLIEALLTLASSEAGPGERVPTDLAAITCAALDDADPAISRQALRARVDIQSAILDGDPVLVQQLVTNLIDNAVRHNIPGGDLRISTKASQAGAVLSVTNSGQVIPAAEVDRLFQPFQRFGPCLGRRDGGHGLLSIVRAIATAHAATITAQPLPGGGLAIDVTFPPPGAPSSLPASSHRPAEAAPAGYVSLRRPIFIAPRHISI